MRRAGEGSGKRDPKASEPLIKNITGVGSSASVYTIREAGFSNCREKPYGLSPLPERQFKRDAWVRSGSKGPSEKKETGIRVENDG